MGHVGMASRSASMSPQSGLAAGHHVTRVVAVESVHGRLLICGGGRYVSVHSCPYGERHGNGGAMGYPDTFSAAPSGARTADGSGALLSCIRQWATGSAVNGGLEENSTDSRNRRIKLDVGEVTCLYATPLPRTEMSLAVVGTSVGSVALLLVDGSRALYRLRETPLLPFSRGRVTTEDVVMDVAIGIDPAGRPEFVVAATATCVVLLDVQKWCSDEPTGLDVGSGTGRASAGLGEEGWASDALRVKGVKALLSGGPGTVQRSCGDDFCAVFTEAPVVRVLVPQRLGAAVAIDVAAVVVLSNGTLRYIKRVVTGGSVRVLEEQHRQRRARGAAWAPYNPEERLGATGVAAPSFPDSRTLPHIVYHYELSSLRFNVCRADGENETGAPGVVKVVNDAALFYSEKDGVAHVALAGTKMVSSAAPRATPQSSSPLPSAMHKGPTMGSLAASVYRSGTFQALGWLAIANNVVLPQCTLDRPRLEREAGVQASDVRQLGEGVSPFMIHVQDCVTSLNNAATQRPSGGGIPGPTSSVPGGGGFAAIAIAADRVDVIAFLASGNDVFAASVADGPLDSKILPAARLIRSFGSVIENLAVGSAGRPDSVFVASGSQVLAL